MYKSRSGSFIKVFALIVCLVLGTMLLTGCDGSTYIDPEAASKQDMAATQVVAGNLASRQPTPTDIDFSLERYNLIRRAYWVNGQHEKANAVVCAVEKPLGYIVLFTDAGSVVGRFTVDGKVSSLNSYLTPDSEFYEQEYGSNGYSYGDGNEWLADVDGSYGENDSGIFFFDTEGHYWEWTGTYLYSDVYMTIDDPVVRYGENG